jgi:hemin uptake protein HemP
MKIFFAINNDSHLYFDLSNRDIDAQMSEFNRPTTLTLRRAMPTASRHSRNERTDPASGLGTASASDGSGSERREQRVVRSDTLLQGGTHVLIAHNGETYQLRATRLGKLILTK